MRSGRRRPDRRSGPDKSGADRRYEEDQKTVRGTVFPTNEVERVTHEVHDTGLDRGLGKGRRDRLGEALQPVHNGDQHVLNL